MNRNKLNNRNEASLENRQMLAAGALKVNFGAAYDFITEGQGDGNLVFLTGSDGLIDNTFGVSKITEVDNYDFGSDNETEISVARQDRTTLSFKVKKTDGVTKVNIGNRIKAGKFTLDYSGAEELSKQDIIDLVKG